MSFLLSISMLLVPVIAFIFFYPQIKKPPYSILVSIILIFLIGNSLFNIGKNVYENYEKPPKWDFLCFWLDGKVGLSGENFYEAKNYQELPLPYDPGSEFKKEIIDVGFPYPPFTMFFFLPLGLFDISKAYLFWQILNLLLCFACIYELWRIFLKEDGILSLLLIAMLMFRLDPTRSTFYFAQTNFLNLLFFLLFWRNRTKERGGFWLALCVAVKPYMALLFLYPLITRKWKTLAVAAMTLLSLTLLSVLAFGKDVVISFINSPIPDKPIWNYTEITNQSLLATILRLNPNQIITGSPLMNPLYLGISVILTLITVWVTFKKNNNHEWAVLSILFLALIIYPANQLFYSVFLIIPVVLLLKRSKRTLVEQIAIIFIIFVSYSLSGYKYGSYMFFANIFMWFVCIIMAAKLDLNSLFQSIVKPKTQNV